MAYNEINVSSNNLVFFVQRNFVKKRDMHCLFLCIVLWYALFCYMKYELDGFCIKFLCIVLWYAFHFSNSLYELNLIWHIMRSMYPLTSLFFLSKGILSKKGICIVCFYALFCDMHCSVICNVSWIDLLSNFYALFCDMHFISVIACKS